MLSINHSFFSFDSSSTFLSVSSDFSPSSVVEGVVAAVAAASLAVSLSFRSIIS